MTEPTGANMANENIVAVLTNEDTGEKAALTVEQVTSILSTGAISEVLEKSYSIVKEYGGGLIEIEAHPDMRNLSSFDGVIEGGEFGNGLRPGRYFALYDVSMRAKLGDEDENEEAEEQAAEGFLLATDTEQIAGKMLEAVPVTVVAQNADGENLPPEEAPYEPMHLWAIRNTASGKYLTITDLLGGLTALAALRLAVEFYGESIFTAKAKPGPQIIKTGKLFADAMRGKPNRTSELWEVQRGAEYLAEIGVLKITAESKKALDTALASSKTLIQLNALATASDYKYDKDRTLTVQTTLDELLEGRGVDVDALAKSTRSKRRAKLKEEILSLAGTSWNYTDESGDFVRVPLAGGTCSVVRGNVTFVFSSDFMGAVLNRGAGRMALDPALLRTDEKNNPYAMPIGYKLLSHSYQNIGKPNECTLSVEKVLEFVEGIPTYEEVKATDRHYDRRIIAPMERDLNHLVEIGVLEWWDYCHAKGEPLTDAEQDERTNAETIGAPTPYDIAINANIQWQLANTYDEQRAETVKSRERRAELAEAAKQREADRKKRIERRKEGYIAKKAAEKELE